jgi:Spy/CpxP family protein refolding chaperone
MQTKGRKYFKTILLATLVVGLMSATSAYAFRGMGGGDMGGGKGHGRGMRWMMNLSPEQVGQVFDLKQKFMNDTAELRKNMMVKRAELMQLWKAEKPDQAVIQAKVKELGNLKAQLMEKAVAQRFAMQKLVPGATGPCPMMGPGGGMGPGMGPGPQGKGPGPGACLMPGPGGMAGCGPALDMEMAYVQEPGE